MYKLRGRLPFTAIVFAIISAMILPGCLSTESPTGSSSYSVPVSGASSNLSIPLTSAPIYSVMTTGDGNETINALTSLNVPSGSSLTFQVTPLSGFMVSPAASGSCPIGTWNPFAPTFYTTGPITANCSLQFSAYSSFVTTFAGTPGQTGSADGTGASIQFNSPRGIAVDKDGNVYVSDTENHTIRKISIFGNSTTIAGRAGIPGYLDGSGNSALLNAPVGIAVDASGNVYVADWLNSVIRKIDPNGNVTTVAGIAGHPGSADGPGVSAQFALPRGIALDYFGNLYVADTGNKTVRKISRDGMVSTLAGTAGQAGEIDGKGAGARFLLPTGITVDYLGYVYVSDGSNHSIRRISPSGDVITFAGSPGIDGFIDGVGTSAQFGFPGGTAIDSSGSLYIGDGEYNTIRKIMAGAIVTTLAGKPGPGGSTNANFGPHASFFNPEGVAVDSFNNVYVADTNNNVIRKIQQK